MIPRTFRFFPWLLLTLTLLAGGCGGGGGAGGGSTDQNLAPVLDPVGNQVVTVGETLTVNIRATDPNFKDTVGIFTDRAADLRLSSTPGNPASATFRWTPSAADLVNNSDTPVSIQFIASDGQLEVSQTIIITVKATAGASNSPPVLNPIGNQSINDTSTLTFTVTASDPDAGDAVTFGAVGLPAGATFAGGVFSWTPGPADLGNYNVTFSATDGLLTVAEQIVIAVVNSAPVITVIVPPPASVTENELVTIDVLVTDPDAGDAIAVTASGSAIEFGGTFSYNATTRTGSFTWIPALVTAGSFSVTFAASDGSSAVAETQTIVYVRTNPLLASDISAPTLPGITIFPQTTPALDGVPELFPGQANFWDIDPDIAQQDGFWNQFEGNLLLAIDDLGVVGEELFPLDQSYAGLTFMTPLLTVHDGLTVATVADHANYAGPDLSSAIVFDPLVEGTRSAWLNATADSRLQQTLDLRQSSGPLTLSWRDEFLVQSGGFFDAPTDDAPYYRVVATDLTTGDRTEIFNRPRSDRGVVETAPVSRTRETRTANLSDFAGKQLVLSFELRGGHQLLLNALGDVEFVGSYALIDNVSLRDANNTEFVANGGFESGLTGWVTNSVQQSQNLRAAPRTVNGLTVTRHFYTVPNQLWARWTDVLTNNTATPVTRRVVLRTFLGSAFKGIIYLDAAINPRALTSWDGTALVDVPDRDIGLVFGSPATVFGNSLPNIAAANEGINANISASALDTEDGSDTIDIVHDVTIPARGQVTLVHFALMSGENTGATAIDTTARATTIDTEIAKILNNFCTDPRYRDGMTNEQLNTLRNFTCP